MTATDGSAARGHAEEEGGTSPAGHETEDYGTARQDRPPGRWGWLREEAGWALEITTLTAMLFTRPVLAAMGSSPAAFRARYATPGVTAVWLLAVALVPALVVVVIGLVGRSGLVVAGHWRQRLRSCWRWRLHLGIVALLAGGVGWRFAAERPGTATGSVTALAIGAVTAAVIGTLRWWKPARDMAATFLRFAAVAPVVFVGQFVTSDAGEEVLRPGRVVDTEAAAAVADQLGDEEPPPVVVMVFDELPTHTLLDEDGQIDPERFPNLARLAATSDWYPNHTSTATNTWNALPALISGRYVHPDDNPRSQPANIFTLLGETHDLSIREQVTDMCGPPYCELPYSSRSMLAELLGDTVSTWEDGTAPPVWVPGLPVLTDDRYPEAVAWMDQLDLTAGSRPPFVFQHELIPHEPWELLPDGTVYERAPFHGKAFGGWTGGDGLVEAATQRHLLAAQAADSLVGEMLDRLDEAGILDDAVIVVTADHGHGFIPGESRRPASEGSLHQVLWTPLLVKTPGQTEGRVADHNVELIDVLPTVAEAVGVEVPWAVDGMALSPDQDRRNSDVVTFTETEDGDIEGDDDGLVRVDGAEHFARLQEAGPLWPGDGPEAAWQRTEHHELLREDVTDLTVGPPVDAELDILDPDRWTTSEPLPLALTARTGLEEGTVVVFTVGGTVAGVTDVIEEDPNLAQAMLLPDVFQDDAELAAYVVQGDVGDETLHPVDVNI